MTYKQFGKCVEKAMKTGAVIMPDGSQLVYHDGMFNTERYFSVYDRYGNCVETNYSSVFLYYLFK